MYSVTVLFFITRYGTAVSVHVGPCCPALLNCTHADSALEKTCATTKRT